MITYQQQLVEQYVPLANKLAFQKKRTLPRHVDVEDLRSAAYFGLVEAASRYNPELGVAFTTFAYPRIFGAIHDFLRQEGYGKRGQFSQVISLNGDTEGEGELQDLLKVKPERNDEEFLEAVSLGLGEQAKEVLRLYFIDDRSMKEVGERFGVSESRISQLIKRYKQRIRGRWSESELRDHLAA